MYEYWDGVWGGGVHSTEDFWRFYSWSSLVREGRRYGTVELERDLVAIRVCVCVASLRFYQTVLLVYYYYYPSSSKCTFLMGICSSHHLALLEYFVSGPCHLETLLGGFSFEHQTLESSWRL